MPHPLCCSLRDGPFIPRKHHRQRTGKGVSQEVTVNGVKDTIEDDCDRQHSVPLSNCECLPKLCELDYMVSCDPSLTPLSCFLKKPNKSGMVLLTGSCRENPP